MDPFITDGGPIRPTVCEEGFKRRIRPHNGGGQIRTEPHRIHAVDPGLGGAPLLIKELLPFHPIPHEVGDILQEGEASRMDAGCTKVLRSHGGSLPSDSYGGMVIPSAA